MVVGIKLEQQTTIDSLIRSGTSFCCCVVGAAQGCSVHREAVLRCGRQWFNYKWSLRRPRHRREERTQNMCEKCSFGCELN